MRSRPRSPRPIAPFRHPSDRGGGHGIRPADRTGQPVASCLGFCADAGGLPAHGRGRSCVTDHRTRSRNDDTAARRGGGRPGRGCTDRNRPCRVRHCPIRANAGRGIRCPVVQRARIARFCRRAGGQIARPIGLRSRWRALCARRIGARDGLSAPDAGFRKVLHPEIRLSGRLSGPVRHLRAADPAFRLQRDPAG